MHALLRPLLQRRRGALHFLVSTGYKKEELGIQGKHRHTPTHPPTPSHPPTHAVTPTHRHTPSHPHIDVEGVDLARCTFGAAWCEEDERCHTGARLVVVSGVVGERCEDGERSD